MSIENSTPITIQSVSSQAAVDKLAGTPLEPWTQLFIDLAISYSIDLNWVLSYMQWETGFGSAGPGGRHPSMDFNDPWDMLCGTPSSGSLGTSIQGASGCVPAPNGYWYVQFPTMEAGIEAGYRLWQSYVGKGWSDWFTSLSVALCGNPDGCNSPWVGSVIQQGNINAAHWPYVPPGPPPPPPPPPGGVVSSPTSIVAGVIGLASLAGAIALMRANQRGGV